MECETAASNEFPGCLENDPIRLGRYEILVFLAQMSYYGWLSHCKFAACGKGKRGETHKTWCAEGSS